MGIRTIMKTVTVPGTLHLAIWVIIFLLEQRKNSKDVAPLCTTAVFPGSKFNPNISQKSYMGDINKRNGEHSVASKNKYMYFGLIDRFSR
jgi:hypothetical protein